MDNYFGYNRLEMVQLVQGAEKFVLDVGCGQGKFALSLRQNGHTVWGIEPEEKASTIAKERCQKVFNCTFDTFSTNKQFDYVVFNDVLEHMADPWDALLITKSLLKSEGKIVASVPNFLYFWEFKKFILSKDFKYKESGIFDKTHLRFFTKKSIIQMFESTGYEIDYISGIHPAKSKMLNILNKVFFGYFEEFKYLQYSVIAKPVRNAK